MNKELVKNQDKPIASRPVKNASSMLALIGQMAINKDVDIDKVERLMKLQVEMQERENEAAFNTALSKTQSEIGVVTKNKFNDQTRSNYADLGAIVKEITPIYTNHGISLSFDSGKEDGGVIPVTCYVSACGHTRSYHYDSPITDKGIKGTTMMTLAHARGSAISYGRRYLTCMIFNIATADDDGNAATIDRITEDQVADLESLIEEVGADKAKFLAWLKTDDLANIQADFYPDCIRALEAKRK